VSTHFHPTAARPSPTQTGKLSSNISDPWHVRGASGSLKKVILGQN